MRNNDIAPKKDRVVNENAELYSTETYTNEQIKSILFELVTNFNLETGEYYVTGTCLPFEDSSLNRVSFMKSVDTLIDAIRDGDPYGTINSLAIITSKKYETDLGLCVEAIEKNTKDNFIKEIPLAEVIFEDEIINIWWKSIPLMMKKAACLLLTSITHLAHKNLEWEITCFNYNGTSCNFYDYLYLNKFSFFQGRIPGTDYDDLIAEIKDEEALIHDIYSKHAFKMKNKDGETVEAEGLFGMLQHM